MTLSKIFEPRLVVVSETEHVIVVDDVDRQGSEPTSAQTYYKAPGRPLGFDVKNLTVNQQCSLRCSPRFAPCRSTPPPTEGSLVRAALLANADCTAD